MSYDFEVSDVFPASAQAIYDTWMSSDGHGAMTGGDADIDPRVGGEYDAWDGYITGRTLELESGRRIVQSWRTTDFAEGDEDSQVEVLLEPIDEETRVTIRHSGVPDGQTSYEESGWEDNYFTPMREYFDSF